MKREHRERHSNESQIHAMSQHEVARRLGLSQQRVAQLERSALDKLRAGLEAAGFAP